MAADVLLVILTMYLTPISIVLKIFKYVMVMAINLVIVIIIILHYLIINVSSMIHYVSSTILQLNNVCYVNKDIILIIISNVKKHKYVLVEMFSLMFVNHVLLVINWILIPGNVKNFLLIVLKWILLVEYASIVIVSRLSDLIDVFLILLIVKPIISKDGVIPVI